MQVNDNAERAPIVLGGRSFRVIDFDRRTVLADHYLGKLIRITGADKVMPMDGEGDPEYVVRLQTLLIDSGKAHELIAGLLLPEGAAEEDWSVAMAKETAAFIGRCNTTEDRELVMSLAMEVVFGFFRQGLAWLQRSLRSLQDKGLLDGEEASPQAVSSAS